MKKFGITLLVLCTVVLSCYAQGDRGHFGISVGGAIPMGDLGSKDLDNENAGMANPGGLIDLSFAYKLGKGNFGLTALIRTQSNPTDVSGVEKELQNADPSINWDVDMKKWKSGCLMAGFFGSFPVSSKAFFEPRFMLGFVRATSPELTITATDPQIGSFWIKQSDATALTFAYLMGVGCKFDISSNLYLLTNLDYLGSNPEFQNVEYTTSAGERATDTWSQKMGTFNISAGIAIKL